MSPEELLLPKTVQDALYYLLSEGWDNQTDVIVSYIDSQARQIKALKAGWGDDRAKVIMLIEKLQLVANDPDWKQKGLSKKLEEYQLQAKEEISSQLAAEHPDLFQEGL